MPNILVAPNLEKMLVQERGIVTVPSEEALVSCFCVRSIPQPCSGLRVNDLPLQARQLQLHLFQAAMKWEERMRVRGYQLSGELRLHGPWPSYEFNQQLIDIESSLWAKAEAEDDPSLLLPFVVDRVATSPYSDYLLVGQFWKQAVLTEIWIPDSTEANQSKEKES